MLVQSKPKTRAKVRAFLGGAVFAIVMVVLARALSGGLNAFISMAVKNSAFQSLLESLSWGAYGFSLILLCFLFVPVFLRLIFSNERIDEPEVREVFKQAFDQAGLRERKLYWIHGGEIGVHNAFACGVAWGWLGPAVFVSRSLWDSLERVEFEAVIRHEVSHLRLGHLSKRLALFLAFLVSLALLTTALVATVSSGLPLLVKVQFGAVVLMGITYVPFLIGISWFHRRQEHQADADAVAFLAADAEALLSALKKINQLNHVNPFARKGLIARLTSTHPSYAQRSRALEQVVQKMRHHELFEVSSFRSGANTIGLRIPLAR